MKSVVMAFFLITVALGNLIVTASGEVRIPVRFFVCLF